MSKGSFQEKNYSIDRQQAEYHTTRRVSNCVPCSQSLRYAIIPFIATSPRQGLKLLAGMLEAAFD